MLSDLVPGLLPEHTVGRGSSGVSNSCVRVHVRLCLRACVSMEVEGQPQVLLLHHLLSFETRSLIGLELYHGGQSSLSESVRDLVLSVPLNRGLKCTALWKLCNGLWVLGI